MMCGGWLRAWDAGSAKGGVGEHSTAYVRDRQPHLSATHASHPSPGVPRFMREVDPLQEGGAREKKQFAMFVATGRKPLGGE